MLGGVKLRKIQQNEKLLGKLHGNLYLACTNEVCHNHVKVPQSEKEKVYRCTKCNKGSLKYDKHYLKNKKQKKK